MGKRSTAAQTAFGPMVIVACEQYLPKAQRLIQDDLALRFLPPAARIVMGACRWRLGRHLLMHLAERSSPGGWGGIACRKRYIDERVSDAVAAGLPAVVVFGAGLDTRVYRLVAPTGVHAYEVDLPVNIDYKQERMRALYGRVSEHVTQVPVDFEIDDLGVALATRGFRIEQATMFVWEGVTQYLTEDGVRKILAFLSKAGVGSRMVFTYVRKDFLDGIKSYGDEKIYQRFVQGGVWHFGIAPEAVGDLLREYGWTEREQAGRSEFAARYIEPTGRDVPIFEIERCVYAEKL
ncbi:MAG: SAM-dependent methyltransferase [Bryobacteraceae bacterium]